MNFNKNLIASNFSKRCVEYDKNANIQKLTAQKLCDFVNNQNYFQEGQELTILDLGSGSSFIAKNLFSHNLKCQIFELDLSLDMLNLYQKNNLNLFKICGDIENLPFAEKSFDLIISSFSLQWLSDFNQIFLQLKKCLKPHGLLAFSIPDNKSFNNLKQLPFKIAQLPDEEKVTQALINNNFIKKFFHQENTQELYLNPIEAIKSFKKIGVNYNFINNNKSNIEKFSEIKKFYLKNFQNNLDFMVDWSISYYIYSCNHD